MYLFLIFLALQYHSCYTFFIVVHEIPHSFKRNISRRDSVLYMVDKIPTGTSIEIDSQRPE